MHDWNFERIVLLTAAMLLTFVAIYNVGGFDGHIHHH